MSQFWANVADRSNRQFTEGEFEDTAYRLITQQVIYYADRGNRVPYHMIEQFEREYERVLDMVGLVLKVNRQLRYACVIPRNPPHGVASLDLTLLALVLRNIYDTYARQGDFNDDGEVVCDLIELQEKFRLSTERDLPARGELKALVKQLQRWGLVRRLDDPEENDMVEMEGQGYALAIRPAIADLLGENAISQLEAFHPTSRAQADGPPEGDDAAPPTADEEADRVQP